MQRGDVISYAKLTAEEGFSIQRGMNFYIPGKDYSIILMSVRKGAPYNDEFINEGKTIIYEGHNIDRKFNKTDLKKLDIKIHNMKTQQHIVNSIRRYSYVM